MSAPSKSSDAHTLFGRAAGVGMAAGGAIGAITGLVIGLMVYAPTAAVAMVELGLPAAVTGAALGLVTGLVIWVVRRTAKFRAG